MEVFFENVYTRDKEWAKSFYSWYFYKRPIMIVIYVVFAVYCGTEVIDSIVMCIMNSHNVFSTVTTCFFTIVICAAFFGFMLFWYNKNISITLKRDIEAHGKPVECTVRVTEQNIINYSSTGSIATLNYSDVSKVINTEKYIFLLSKSKMFYTFKKDSFVLGTPEAFLAFLQRKNVKV